MKNLLPVCFALLIFIIANMFALTQYAPGLGRFDFWGLAQVLWQLNHWFAYLLLFMNFVFKPMFAYFLTRWLLLLFLHSK